MSHRTGAVYRKHTGELLGYIEYDGTSDIALRSIQQTTEAVSAAWRKPAADRTCACEDPILIPVEIQDDVEDGYRWTSIACGRCMSITGPCETTPA